jgi:dihydropyrimidinase
MEGPEALIAAFPDYAEIQSTVAGASIAHEHDYDDGFYVVHVSAGSTVDALAALQDAGYEVTGETCPHYLTLTAEEAGQVGKVNPPVRTDRDRERLWEGIRNETITCIGTDHCVKYGEKKTAESIWDVTPAFPGSALMLPLVLSEGVNEGRIDLEGAVEVTSMNTAKAWNLYPKKGTIRVGSDADIVVVDLDETATVTPERLQGAADYSPYEGMDVTGWPTHTVVRGTVAYEDGTVVGEPGIGEHIDRPI